MTVDPKDMPFSLIDARKLRMGIYHEEDADDDEGPVEHDKSKMTYIGRDEDFGKAVNLENFEKAVAKIMTKSSDNDDLNVGDEIPISVREELDLPKSIGKNEVNYTMVRIRDCNVKRKTPIWSGQDVLEDSLTEDQSLWVTAFTNAVRIWPKGLFGYLKKVRCFLKIITKSSFFGSFMLGAVLMNTVVMAMERFDLTVDERVQLE